MYELLKYTAWEMEKIKPYGFIHISFFVIGIVLSILISYKLKNIDRKTLNKILFSFGIFLLLSEIYKQLFYTIYLNNGVYPKWIFPFQLCSIPMYICLIIPFINNKKIYKSLMVFLISYNLLGGFISFIEPSGLIHEYYTLTIHAFLWHMIISFIGILAGLNKNIKYNKNDFKLNIVLYIILCIIAFSINIILGGDINMFFIGPNISSIIVFKTIATKFGWFVNDLIYIPVLTLGSYLIYCLFTKIKK